MTSTLLGLLATTLILLPLRWQLPDVVSPTLTSQSWNDGVILLSLVLSFFYLFCLRKAKIKLNNKILRLCLWLTALLGIVIAIQIPNSSPNVTEAFRLLLIIWCIPFIELCIRPLSATQAQLLFVGLIALHSVWGVAQFVQQDDLRLYPIGETRLSIDEPGIAKFEYTSSSTQSTDRSVKLLRAYGPFPHPNSLGGSLALALMSASVLYLKLGKKQSVPIFGILLFGLLATFSRSALLSAALGILILVMQSSFGVNVGVKLRTLTVIIAATLLVFTPFLADRILAKNDVAMPERWEGSQLAFEIIKQRPWLGVGIGQYETSLGTYAHASDITLQPWQIAPVHNVPQLLVAEWGTVGGVGLIGILLWQGRRFIIQRWRYLVPLIPLMLLDHYLLTQTAPLVLLMAWLVIVSRLPESAGEPRALQ